jgi:hypothetical protein
MIKDLEITNLENFIDATEWLHDGDDLVQIED